MTSHEFDQLLIPSLEKGIWDEASIGVEERKTFEMIAAGVAYLSDNPIWLEIEDSFRNKLSNIDFMFEKIWPANFDRKGGLYAKYYAAIK